MLCCPKCQCALIKDKKRFYCENGHSYDIAKRGYVNLMPSMQKQSGDDKDMVKARTMFLSQGYYEPLRTTLTNIIDSLSIKTLVDAGCGEGYYTNEVKIKHPQIEIIGFDVSKFAIDEACKASVGVQYTVCSVFHMPLQAKRVQAGLSVFAPFDEKEMYRVLEDDGYFIRVSPGKRHLMGLKEVLYQDVYENEDTSKQLEGFVLYDRKEVAYTIQINNAQQIWALFQMTPYYWKSSKQASDQLKGISSLETEVVFEIDVYKKIK